MGQGKKKIAIVTIWKRYLLTNYGTFFQHYALRRFLKSLGYDCFRVNDLNEKFGRFAIVAVAMKQLGGLMHTFDSRRCGLLREIYGIVSKVKVKYCFLKDFRNIQGQEHECQDFENTDLVLVGSDQVWTGIGTRCWGREMPVRAPMISYAASADWLKCEQNQEWTAAVTQDIKAFSCVSVREKKGVDVFQKMGVKVEQTVDPVFFMSKHDYLSLPRKDAYFKRQTLLCYFVNLHTHEDVDFDYLKGVAAQLHCELKVIAIQGAERFVPRSLRVIVSPVDFIRAMRDAAYVITNSFHGLAFSILLEKQFIAMRQVNKPGTDQNQRQRELLSRYDLSSKWAMSGEPDAFVRTLMSPIDWNRVRIISNETAERSKEWLKSAISVNVR